MKSIHCTRCGKEISTHARRCPSCFAVNDSYYELLPSVLADTHRAEYDFMCDVESELNYHIDEGGELIWYNQNMRVLVIPDKVKMFKMGAFPDDHYGEIYTPGENGFFEDNQNIEIVYIPGNVIEIPTRAFQCCKNLKKVVIENGVERIGHNAFAGCLSLEEITFPPSVSQIGMTAFAGCSSLTVVNIGSGISAIGAMAFSGCNNLESLSISESEEPLLLYDEGHRRSGRDSTVFSDCPKLKNINLHYRPNIDDIIVSSIFTNDNLHIEIDRKCKDKGYSIQNTNRGEKIVYSSILEGKLYKFIGQMEECLSLDSNIIGIKKGAFPSNQTVKTLLLPAGIKDIEIEALFTLDSLENIFVDVNNPCYSSIDGVLLSKNQEDLLFYPPQKKQVIYYIPNCVRRILDGAFERGGPQNLFIPDSVKSVGSQAINKRLIHKIRYPKFL